MFQDTGEWIKKTSKILLVICIVLAIILFFVGISPISSNLEYTSMRELLTMTSEDYLWAINKGYDFMTEPYEGLMKVKLAFTLALSALGAIPLYGFGTLIDDVHAIRSKLVQVDNKTNEESDNIS